MFVLLVVPEPELSFQALQAGTGTGVPPAPSAKSSLVLQGKTLALKDFNRDIVLQAGRPSWGSFLWTLSIKTWKRRKVSQRHFVPLAAPFTWELLQGWPGRSQAQCPPHCSQNSLSRTLELLETVWGVTLAPDWTVYLYSPSHAFSEMPPQIFHQEGKWLPLIKKAHLWGAKWAWIELTPRHPPNPCARWQTITAYASLDTWSNKDLESPEHPG